MRMQWARREDGQMLVIFAICLTAIIAMTGLVIDGGMTFVQRREQQNVADAAALAGAYAYVNSNSTGAATAAALSSAAANGYTVGTDGVVVNVNTATPGGALWIDVNITKPHRNYFSGIVGFSTWPVSVTASAQGGMPNGVIGAMPVLFNQKAFPHAVGSGSEMSFDEPGVGNPDVPQTATQFNWTVYCTASGSTCNGDSNTVDDLIHDRGNSTTVDLTDDIGPLNAGAHATLFSDLANYVGTSYPVGIVDDDGNLVGWAMFHITGSVGGSTKQIRGYFDAQVNPAAMKIIQGGGTGLNFGSVPVRLSN
jgi:Flp pilus assembly protein TadG